MPLSLNFGENFLDILDYDSPENNNNNNNKSHVSYQHASSGPTFHPNDSLSNPKLLPNSTYHPNESLSNSILHPSAKEGNDSSLFNNILFHPNESLSKEILFKKDTDEASDSFGVEGLVAKDNVTDQLNYDLR